MGLCELESRPSAGAGLLPGTITNPTYTGFAGKGGAATLSIKATARVSPPLFYPFGKLL